MQEQLEKIKSVLTLIPTFRSKYEMRRNSDVDEPLLYCGVVNTNVLPQLATDVEQFFDKPYKPSGEGAFFKNLFDKFIRSVGGVRKEQTLYRLQISENIFMYCSFWPWGTQPEKTSIRLGLLCYDQKDNEFFEKELSNDF